MLHSEKTLFIGVTLLTTLVALYAVLVQLTNMLL